MIIVHVFNLCGWGERLVPVKIEVHSTCWCKGCDWLDIMLSDTLFSFFIWCVYYVLWYTCEVSPFRFYCGFLQHLFEMIYSYVQYM